MTKIYLDHHSGTFALASCIEAMSASFRDHWGSSLHRGRELGALLEKYEDVILGILGSAAEDKFYFFHSRAQAFQELYFAHYFDEIRHTGKNHFLMMGGDDMAALAPLERLKELGCHIKTLPVNAQGQLTRAALEEAIHPRTSFVSIAWASGLTGVIQPIVEIAELCSEKGVSLHVDASHILGKLYFRFEDLSIDYLTFEGALLHSLPGTAALLAKEKSISLRGENSVGGMGALAKALEGCEELFNSSCLETARLRNKFEKGILVKIPDAQVLFQKADRLPNCSAIAFPGACAESLLFLLHRRGIAASIGNTDRRQLFQQLVAAGIDPMLAECSLSFSLSFETKEEEINAAIDAVVESVQKLKKLSEAL